MGGYAPRARGKIMRPRHLRGSSGRPLNFTVRRQHMSDKGDVEQLIASGRFEEAFDWLLSRLNQAPGSENLLRISRVLSSRVRSKCIDLSCNKATDGSREHLALEALLRKIIEVNGEGFYG